MKFLRLLIVFSGIYNNIYEVYGMCNIRHFFKPMSSDGFPCTPGNVDCIRLFFVNTWNCIQARGLLPEVANVTKFEFPAPSSNMSVTTYDMEIKGLDGGRSIQFYNRRVEGLLMMLEYPHIDVFCKKLVVHRSAAADVIVNDFHLRLDYVFLGGTFMRTYITISRNVVCYIEKVYEPVFHCGSEQTYEELNHLFKILLQNVQHMILKLFVVRSDTFMKYLIDNNICRPNGFLMSDGSNCLPTGV